MKKINTKRKKLTKNLGINTQEVVEEEQKIGDGVMHDNNSTQKWQFCHEPCIIENFKEKPYGYIVEINNTKLHLNAIENNITTELKNPHVTELLKTLDITEDILKENYKGIRYQILKKWGHFLHNEWRKRIKMIKFGNHPMMNSFDQPVVFQNYSCPLWYKAANGIIYPTEVLLHSLLQDHQDISQKNDDKYNLSVFKALLSKDYKLDEKIFSSSIDTIRTFCIYHGGWEKKELLSSIEFGSLSLLEEQMVDLIIKTHPFKN